MGWYFVGEARRSTTATGALAVAIALSYAVQANAQSVTPSTVSAGPAPAVVAFSGPQCSLAVPFAWGEQPEIWGDWVTYSRKNITPSTQLFPPITREIGLHHLGFDQNFYPILPNTTTTSQDLSPRVVGNYLFFIRMHNGGMWELILTDIRNAANRIVLDQGSGIWGVMPAVMRAYGGTDLDSANEDDFVLTWTKTVVMGSSATRENKWCRASDCMQFNITSGFISPSAAVPGTGPQDLIFEFQASTSMSGPGNTPDFFYIYNDPGFNSRAEYLAGGQSHHSLAGPFSGANHITNSQLVGPFLSYTRRYSTTSSEAKVGLVVAQGLPDLFRSQPPSGSRDDDIAMSSRSSAHGSANGILVSWARFGATLPNKIMAAYVNGNQPNPTQIEIPIHPLVHAGGWRQCSEPSVYQDRVVFTCRNASYPDVPIILKSDCRP